MAKKQDSEPRSAEDLVGEITAAMDAEFHHDSDRVIAVVGAAYLDDCVESLLRAALRDDFDAVDGLVGQFGPLGSNGARARLAYCLGLVSRDHYDDLRRVADIRNKFAHNYRLRTLDASPVRELCAQLRQPAAFASMTSTVIVGGESEHAIRYAKEITATPRQQYETTIRMLFITLAQRVNFVRRVDDHQWFSQEPV